ncbi:hypothetical protein M3Y97_00612800 [Aphelenchoides bicaudatus]|nr:hypothetical protein M3Y97_00612800 [Aphelenchoides bicaudatus]
MQHQFRRQGSIYGTEIVLLEMPDRNGQIYGVQMDLRSSSLPPLTPNSFRPINNATLENLKRRNEIIEQYSESFNSGASWTTYNSPPSIASSEAFREQSLTMFSDEISAPPVLYSTEPSDQLFRHSETFSSHESSAQRESETREVPIGLVEEHQQQLSVETGKSSGQPNLPFSLMSPIPELSECQSSGDEFFRGLESSTTTIINLPAANDDVSPTSVEYTSIDTSPSGKSTIDSTFEERNAQEELEKSESAQQAQIIQSLRGLEQESNIDTSATFEQKDQPSVTEAGVELKGATKTDPTTLNTRQSSERQIQVGVGFNMTQMESEEVRQVSALKRTDSAQLDSPSSKEEQQQVSQQFFLPDQNEKANQIKPETVIDVAEKKCQEAGDQTINYFQTMNMTESDEKLVTSVLQHAQSGEKLNIRQPQESIVNVDTFFAPKTAEEFVQQVNKMIDSQQTNQMLTISEAHLDAILEKLEQAPESSSKSFGCRLKVRVKSEFKASGLSNAISVVDLKNIINQEQQKDLSFDVPTNTQQTENLTSKEVTVSSELDLQSKTSTTQTIDVEILKSVPNQDVTSKTAQQAGDQVINYFGDVRVQEKDARSESTTQQISNIKNELDSKASSEHVQFVNEAFAAETIEEFVEQVNNLTAKETDNRQFKVSQVDVHSSLQKIEDSLVKEGIVKERRLESITSILHEFGNVESFTVVEMKRISKLLQSAVDTILKTTGNEQNKLRTQRSIETTTQQTEDLHAQKSTFEQASVVGKDGQKEATQLSSKQSAIEETNIDGQFELKEDQSEVSATKTDSNVDAATKQMRPAGNETVNYIHDAQSREDAVQLHANINEKPHLDANLSAKQSQEVTIDVGHVLTAKTVDEFTQQINNLAENEAGDRQFKVSKVDVLSTLQNIEQNQSEAKEWAEKIKDSMQTSVVEYGKADSFTVVDLQKALKDAKDVAGLVINVPTNIQQSIKTPASTDESTQKLVDLESKQQDGLNSIIFGVRPGLDANLTSMAPTAQTVEVSNQFGSKDQNDSVSITGVDKNAYFDDKQLQEAGDQTVNYVQDIQIVAKDNEAAIEVKTPVRIDSDLSTKASSLIDVVVDKELTANSVEEFAQQVNQITSGQGSQPTILNLQYSP